MNVSGYSSGQRTLFQLLRKARDFFDPNSDGSVITVKQLEQSNHSLVTQYNDLLASFNGLNNELTHLQVILESKKTMGVRITSCLARINKAKSNLDEFFPKGERS